MINQTHFTIQIQIAMNIPVKSIDTRLVLGHQLCMLLKMSFNSCMSTVNGIFSGFFDPLFLLSCNVFRCHCLCERIITRLIYYRRFVWRQHNSLTVSINTHLYQITLLAFWNARFHHPSAPCNLLMWFYFVITLGCKAPILIGIQMYFAISHG